MTAILHANSWSWMGRCLVGVCLVLLQGCASVQSPDLRDPWESWNRGVFKFNDAADKAVLKPVATAYRDGVPTVVQKGVRNFLNNLDDVWSAFNNALQLRGQDMGDNLGRVMVNSTIGLLGLFDVASDLEIERHPSNFGLTLGRWGVGAGPYVVLPLLGPSSLRDTAGLPVDMQAGPTGRIENVGVRNTLTVLDVVRTRASFLGAEDVVDGAALDKYSFMRDAYLQRRRNLVFDGNPPDEDPPPDNPPVSPPEP